MDTYYEILGLKPGATQAEIKKAYFRLIRKYSPESDPKQFQKIREAYDQLKKAANMPMEPKFAQSSDPLAREFLDQIEECRRMGDYEKCREICEMARERFPEELCFLYLFIPILRKCNNTGKAIKNAELLVTIDSENKWAWRELAFSYEDRGYTRKAFRTCRKAYEFGCRDAEFILMYSVNSAANKAFDEGSRILLELVGSKRRWAKEEIVYLIEAHLGLMGMEPLAERSRFTEILDSLSWMTEQYGIYLEEYIRQISTLLVRMSSGRTYQHEDYGRFIQILEMFKRVCHTEPDRAFIELAMEEVEYQHLLEDQRLREIFRYAFEIYFDTEEEDEVIRKFSLADIQLCMIAEREYVLSQIEVIRQEYPHFYGALEDFLEKLGSEKNTGYLKESLLKWYCQVEPCITGGFYFDWYPQEKVRMRGKLINEGFTDQPYMREEKKVGRNDPCPCGSGKKYKHCCMKKR